MEWQDWVYQCIVYREYDHILYYTIELRLCVRKNAEEIFICGYVNIVIQIILDLNSSTALRVAINQATSALRRKYFGDLAQHHV